MSWYRTGTVAVTNGSKTVTGVGTLFTTAVNVGDAFALVDANLNPTGAWYEVESVTNNTTLVLKQSYAGSTGSNKQYCVFNLVGNMTTPSFAQRLATFFASFQSLIDKPTTTPTALGIPVADENGNIADGWIPETVARVDDMTEALALKIDTATATATPTALGIPIADENGNIADGWIPATVARLASPALTGSPTAPTAAASDNSTKIATTKFVKDQAYFNKANILGTVSQSGGVPTGAVIERGSNANGEYVKFADGTQICVVRFTDFPSIQAGGTVPATTTKTWTFPAEFSTTNSIAVSAVLEVNSVHQFTGFSVNISAGSSVVLRLGILATTTAAELKGRAMAIGRWF